MRLLLKRFCFTRILNNLNMKINFLSLMGGIISTMLVIGLVSGKVQEYVYFQDSLNEMVMALMGSMMAIGFFSNSVEKKVSNI